VSEYVIESVIGIVVWGGLWAFFAASLVWWMEAT
jgi:hypothetical protein